MYNRSLMESILQDKDDSFCFEGILEIFNDSQGKTTKEFCGKQIDLNFQHTVETQFVFRNFENGSVYSSVYMSEQAEDEEMEP